MNPCAAANSAENMMIARMTQSRAFILSLAASIRGQLAPCQNPVRLYVLLAGLASYIVRQCRSGRLFIPLNRFQIIAHKLLIERLLGPSGLILIGRPKA